MLAARASLAGPPGRYPILDALRAIAIMLVLARHWSGAAEASYGPVPGGPLAILSANGWIGVDLFFVLSGFLIGTHFAGPQALPFSMAGVRDFYRRRAFRTLPLYWAMMAICALVNWCLYGQALTALDLVTHLLFLQDYLGTDLMVTLWSLAVEEKFYLAAPLLLYVCLRARRTVGVALLLAGISAMLWSMIGATHALQEPGYSSFFWGVRAPFHHAALAILAGVLVAIVHGATASLSAPRWLFFVLAAFAVALHSWRDWLSQDTWPLTCVVIAVSATMFAALVRCGLAVNAAHPAFGASRPLRAVARLSYALYLVHYPLLGPAGELCNVLLGAAARQHPAIASLVFLLLYCALSWCAAWLLHVAVEQPFLRLRDRVAPSPASGLASATV
jgi:peptidoglycan/LPS O-acetylase OafA/YrhL